MIDPVLAEAQIRELLAANRVQEAETLCRSVLAAYPNDAGALHQLGLIALRTNHLPQALELIGRAVALRPGVAEFHYSLSLAHMAVGRFDAAEAPLRAAVGIDPQLAAARVNLGAVLGRLGRYAEAEAEFRSAVALRPSDATIYVNLGRVIRWQERLGEAIECYRRAVQLDPAFAPTYSALGSALREAGRIGEAVEAFRTAVRLAPTFREAHSNLLYALQFDPDVSEAEKFAEHLRWAGKFAEPLRSAIARLGNVADPERRVRVGYVSPDLREHPVGFFMEPILEGHDRARFEVFCYADVAEPDALTRRLQAHCDVWRATAGMNEEQLAAQIRADAIDVLVDLTQHMRGSRLTVFSRRPAPVQITHLAYCATSGLRAMDWCVTDAHMSPPEEDERQGRWFTERLLRLGRSYWCYLPSATGPAVGESPAARRGAVTFGSLNTLAKVNPRVIALWARVLAAVPGSRLMVSAIMGEGNADVRAMFEGAGIAGERLVLVGRRPRDGYLELYNEIDIALDPFPYCGGTTSLDGLWMGVPLVTLAGETPLARTGVTLLRNVGLEELIAGNEEEYVRIAADLAGDLPRLAESRRTLRGRLQSSPLMDAVGYVRDLEGAYRAAWGKWCRVAR